MNVSTYKCWSPDVGIEEDDASIVKPDHDWYDMEDVAEQYIESRYHDWEQPQGPFNVLIRESGPEGQPYGDVHTYNVSVDWSPNFYLTEKT